MAVVKKKKSSSSAKEKINKKPKSLTTDFTGVEGRKGARRIKEGDYLFKITDYEAGKSDKKDDEGKKRRFLVFKFDILKGPSTGSFSDLFGLSKKQLWRYRLFLEALGIKIGGETDVPLKKLVGKNVGGTVEDDEYNGKKKSQVSDYFSAEDYENLGSDDEDEDEDDEDEDEEDEDEDEDEEDVAESVTEDDEEDEELEVVDDDDI
jgi:hypothetical protein